MSLSDVIWQDCQADSRVQFAGHEYSQGKNAGLSLIAFCLDELCQATLTSENNPTLLTFSSYRQMGGLAGAISKRAEIAVQELKESIPNIGRVLPKLFNQLIQIAPVSLNKPASAKELITDYLHTDSKLKKIVDVFVSNRLFIIIDNRIRIAHESLIHQWERIQNWLETDREFQTFKSRMEDQVAIWVEDGRQNSTLISGRKSLAEAKNWLKHRKQDLSQDVISFIELSVSRSRFRNAAGLAIAGITCVFLAAIFLKVNSILQELESTREEIRDKNDEKEQLAMEAAERQKESEQKLAYERLSRNELIKKNEHLHESIIEFHSNASDINREMRKLEVSNETYIVDLGKLRDENKKLVQDLSVLKEMIRYISSNNRSWEYYIGKENYTSKLAARFQDFKRSCFFLSKHEVDEINGICYDLFAPDTKGPRMVLVTPDQTDLKQGFSLTFISRYEIRVKEFNDFCKLTSQCEPFDRPRNHPITGISVDLAQAYVKFLTERSGFKYRIPTEQEWFFAAKADEHKKQERINCRTHAGGFQVSGFSLEKVNVNGKQAENSWGVRNYLGNASELVSGEDGYYAAGGSYLNNIYECNETKRVKIGQKLPADTGLRVIREL